MNCVGLCTRTIMMRFVYVFYYYNYYYCLILSYVCVHEKHKKGTVSCLFFVLQMSLFDVIALLQKPINIGLIGKTFFLMLQDTMTMIINCFYCYFNVTERVRQNVEQKPKSNIKGN